MVNMQHPAAKAALACTALLTLCLLFFQSSSGQGAVALPGEHSTVDDDALAAVLGEHPQPRGGMEQWEPYHKHYVEEAEAARKGEGFEIIVYGDSITEAFLGGWFGKPARNYSKSAEVWKTYMLPRHPTAHIFSIAGDRIAHLLWRLRNGEGPAGLRPKALLLLIGTNDVARLASAPGRTPAEAGAIISQGQRFVVAELLRQAPQAAVVVVSLPPLQPPKFSLPAKMLQAVVDAANEQTAAWARKAAKKLRRRAPRLMWQDCSGLFLTKNGLLQVDRIPDGIHPQGEGAELLLKCMLQGLDEAVGGGGGRKGGDGSG